MRKLAFASVTIPWLVLFACADDSTPGGGTSLPEAGKADVGQSTPDVSVPDTSKGTTDPPDSSVADSDVPDAPACTIPDDETFDATLKITVDDKFKLYVNGALVKDFPGTWQSPQTETIKLKKSPLQKNVIAVAGANMYNAGGLDRMIVVDVSWNTGDGGATEHRVVSDDTWKRGPVPDGGAWTEIGFDETGWEAATVVGSHGDGPYGAVLGTSTAKYIWSYDPAQVDIGSKEASEIVYFRKSFWVDMKGAPQATPQACP